MTALTLIASYLLVGFMITLSVAIIDRYRVVNGKSKDLLFKTPQQHVIFTAFSPLAAFIAGCLCVLLLLSYALGWWAKVLSEYLVPIPQPKSKIYSWPPQEVNDDETVN